MMGLFCGHWMFIIEMYDDSRAKIVIANTVRISLDWKGKGKVVPVHAMWVCEGVEV